MWALHESWGRNACILAKISLTLGIRYPCHVTNPKTPKPQNPKTPATVMNIRVKIYFEIIIK
jgi:hypothetical protein